MFDFESEREKVSAAARDVTPVLIGFSLIFQFYIDRFGALIRYLRAGGVDRISRWAAISSASAMNTP